MKSHLLTDRIEAFEPVRSESRQGTKSSVSFVPYREGRALMSQRIRVTGNRIEESGEAFADYHAEYIVNSGHPVLPGWRVRDCETGITYTVATVFPDRRNRLLRLSCDRLNN